MELFDRQCIVVQVDLIRQPGLRRLEGREGVVGGVEIGPHAEATRVRCGSKADERGHRHEGPQLGVERTKPAEKRTSAG